MKRTQTFIDYVLSRAKKRGNPYNFSSALDIPYYTLDMTDEWEAIESLKSAWTYAALIEHGKTGRVIFPHEVVHCKICKALFLPIEEAEDL